MKHILLRGLLAFFVAGGAAVVAVATGMYPVALVNGRPVWFSSWERLQVAAFTLINGEQQAEGKPSVDFNEPEQAELVRRVRRDSLAMLIDDTILAREGKKIYGNFSTLAEEKIAEALRGADNLSKSVELLYGLSEQDFVAAILTPQARKEVIGELLARQKTKLLDWMEEKRGQARVHILFAPFEWKGKGLE